jgi:hypothetical protein
VNNWLVGVLLLAGCVFPPDVGNGSVRCGGGGSCPPELHCAHDGRCYRSGSGPRDAGLTSDGTNGDASLFGAGAMDLARGPADLARGNGGSGGGGSGGGGRDMTGCVPRTCASVNATCGYYPDGCGVVLDCYANGTSCGPGNSAGTCAGGGQPYTCGRKGSCTPLTQCPTGTCGVILPDNCNNVVVCPACP